MRKSHMWLTIGATMLVLLLTTTAALGASPHFKKGGTPTCSDQGTVLTCGGSLAGLGNGDVDVVLTSDALASFECVNKGGTAAPGQNKVPFTASGSSHYSATEIKNGNLTFTASAPSNPPTATPEEAGCPNGKTWTATRLTGIDFANVKLTISQGDTLLFTCTYPGTVSGTVTLTC